MSPKPIRCSVEGNTEAEHAMAQAVRRARVLEELFPGDANAEERFGHLIPNEIPPFVNLTENLNRAAEMDEFQFKRAVRTGGEWDYKKGGRRQYEEFGNWHYGLVAAELKWLGSLSAAHAAGGIYQVWSGTSRAKWWRTFFDDPEDFDAISRGWWTRDESVMFREFLDQIPLLPEPAADVQIPRLPEPEVDLTPP